MVFGTFQNGYLIIAVLQMAKLCQTTLNYIFTLGLTEGNKYANIARYIQAARNSISQPG